MLLGTIVIVLSVRSVSVSNQSIRKFVVIVVAAAVVVVVEKIAEIGSDICFL
ncbi:hypothetical protein QNH48_05980 [Neobacillus sp. YX16]|uniref:hypothetical protein n=1 Tax=Neobacillus sp. YX16 TaxID=3047874 RepID=UPI0024C2F95B|nr:hypothetical protein [Neobacillus sp. YX16]WHZ04201.1 hypothetical protein QNH48_05980 [Neobacillus sp. YX16]